MWKPVDGMRCDEPMARSMGILPYCDKKCENCMAVIRHVDAGREVHGNPGTDYKVRQRNIDKFSERKRGKR